MLTQRHCDTHDYPILKQKAEAAEARSEAAAETYHDSIKTMTRLLEDKRETKPRKRFLDIF